MYYRDLIFHRHNAASTQRPLDPLYHSTLTFMTGDIYNNENSWSSATSVLLILFQYNCQHTVFCMYKYNIIVRKHTTYTYFEQLKQGCHVFLMAIFCHVMFHVTFQCVFFCHWLSRYVCLHLRHHFVIKGSINKPVIHLHAHMKTETRHVDKQGDF